MKKSFIVLCLAWIIISCSSYQEFNRFYNSHKNDNNVSSFEVPKFLKSMARGISPEISNMLGNVKDFKSISFTDCSAEQSALINNQINGITKNFTDVHRENTPEKRSLISVKEKGDKITELLIHHFSNNNHKVLFLRGDFDPAKIKNITSEDGLDNLLLQ